MEALQIITLWCIVVSLLFVLAIERYAGHIRRSPLAAWRRWSIPLPIFLLAGGNLDGVFCLEAYLKAHPGVISFRDAKTDAWHVDVLFSAGLLGMMILPLLLSQSLKDARHIAPSIWILFFAWVVLVWCPMAVSTGVPLQD